MRRTTVTFGLCLLLAAPAIAQDDARSLLKEAKGLYAGPSTSASDLAQVRKILDRIVAEYPASDLAVSILLEETIEDLDVARIYHRTAGQPHEDGPSATSVPAPEVPAATRQTQVDLALDKQAIRDVQARLLVLGHNPNGIDGIVGSGTRSALRDWQAAHGVEASGYINASQLAELKAQSQAALDTWLKVRKNARLYSPPPPVALGPDTLAGTWRFTATCGRNSRLGRTKINGAITMGHAGGNVYTGRARNSQGLRGDFSVRLRGRRVSGNIDWGFLAGQTRFSGSVANRKLVIKGRDSNRCAFYAAKSS